MAKLVGGTSLSLFIVLFKNFQASRNQIMWLAGNYRFWAENSFLIQEKKTLIWHGLAEMSPRDSRAFGRL